MGDSVVGDGKDVWRKLVPLIVKGSIPEQAKVDKLAPYGTGGRLFATNVSA